MRYGRDPDPELGARVQLFVRNAGERAIRIAPDTPIRLRGLTPEELLADKAWTWHDLPSAWPDAPLDLPPGSLSVWSFNTRGADWGVGTSAAVEVTDRADSTVNRFSVDIAEPSAWMSAVTFLASDDGVHPDTMVVHIANARDASVRVKSFRLWLPESGATWRELRPQTASTQFASWPADGNIAPDEKGIIRADTGQLPLTYTAIELACEDAEGNAFTLWTHLRIKREAFDISGGWVHGGKPGPQVMTFEPFLKTLRRMHVNTAHIADHFPGYTDQTSGTGLYSRYPLKFFHGLTPTEKYETAEMLRRIHAVEFLGEPQYGGGRPVPPMEVWQKLAPYQSTKLPTTVTHSEERVWRYYAGLSDFPHYDAYRVCAPSPDAWFKYDRWGGKKIGWGAPLETIGDMCRSLRELNRPMPTAYWSQGPHEGWGPMWGRRRASPTANELRLQAYHALSSRITSLYWFNLTLGSLVQYRDTLDELTRVGREIRLLEDVYLAGDAYRYRRVMRGQRPDWDLASIVSPDVTLLFALDLDYRPDKDERVFKFGPPRAATFCYELPTWMRTSAEVFRVDADGTYDVGYEFTDGGIEISDRCSKIGIYVVAAQNGTRERLEARRQELLRYEADFKFDPAGSDADFAQLVRFFEDGSGG